MSESDEIQALREALQDEQATNARLNQELTSAQRSLWYQGTFLSVLRWLAFRAFFGFGLSRSLDAFLTAFQERHASPHPSEEALRKHLDKLSALTDQIRAELPAGTDDAIQELREVASALSALLRVQAASSIHQSIFILVRFTQRLIWDIVPIREASQFLAAVLRRVLIIASLAFLANWLPIVLLVVQIRAETRESQATRRTDLYGVLYQEQPCPPEAPSPRCPAANRRHRQSALYSLLDIERHRISRRITDLDLTGAFLSGVDVSRVDLRGVRLQRADLSQAYLQNTVLAGVDLTGAALTDALLSSADLTATELYRTDFSGALLSETDLTGAQAQGANFTNATLERTVLRDATLEGARFTGARLRKADLTGADLRRADFSGANLEDAQLTDARLLGARYSSVTRWPERFSYATSGAIGPWADLHGSNLSGTDLAGADLTGANLANTNLTGADMTGTDLSRADLRGATFLRTLLTDVSYDEDTQWPEGFTLPLLP